MKTPDFTTLCFLEVSYSIFLLGARRPKNRGGAGLSVVLLGGVAAEQLRIFYYSFAACGVLLPIPCAPLCSSHFHFSLI